MSRYKRRSLFLAYDCYYWELHQDFEIVVTLAEWLLCAPHVDGLNLEVINGRPPESLG